MSFIDTKSKENEKVTNLIEENQRLKKELDVFKRQNVDQSIWGKRVDDLKLEVTRLDSELWASKDQKHFEARLHQEQISAMKE